MTILRKAPPAAALLLIILLGGYLLLRPGPADQVAAAMADVRRGLAEGDATLLVDRLDPAYDLDRLWPRQSRRLDALGARLGLAGRDAHQVLRRVLALYFLEGKPQARFTYTIDRVAKEEDGRVTAVVTVGLTGRGLPFTIDPPVTRSFTLTGQGRFWPRLRFLDHEPILP